ncbi:AP-2 complex subunit alpha-1-like [Cariama cristata]
MAEAFATKVPGVLVAGDTMDSVKRSTVLCLLCLHTGCPDLMPVREWMECMVHLLKDQPMEVVTAAVSPITCLCKESPGDFTTCSLHCHLLPQPVPRTTPTSCRPLGSPSNSSTCSSATRPRGGSGVGCLVECLEMVLEKAQEIPKSRKVQYSSAKNPVIFEAIALIIHYDRVSCSQDSGTSLWSKSSSRAKNRFMWFEDPSSS